MTKKELFNARNNGKAIEKGMVIEITSIGEFSDTDKDGNPVTVTALLSSDGTIYTTISATVHNSIDMLTDILADEGMVTVRVNQNTSNSGREFYQLEIL